MTRTIQYFVSLLISLLCLFILAAGINAALQAERFHDQEQARLLLHSALVVCSHDYEARSRPESVSGTLALHGGRIKYGLKKIDPSTVYIIVSSEFGKVSLTGEYMADINLKPL